MWNGAGLAGLYELKQCWVNIRASLDTINQEIFMFSPTGTPYLVSRLESWLNCSFCLPFLNISKCTCSLQILQISIRLTWVVAAGHLCIEESLFQTDPDISSFLPHRWSPVLGAGSGAIGAVRKQSGTAAESPKFVEWPKAKKNI